MLHLRASCCFHQGNSRGNNEDNFAFGGRMLPDCRMQKGCLSLERKLRPMRTALGVFDGMGGLPEGEKASRVAAEEFIRSTRRTPLRLGNGEKYLQDCCHALNRAVCAFAEERKHPAGTTAVLILFTGKYAAIGNVGDSRAYLFRGDALRQLSEDHSDRMLLKQLGVEGRSPLLAQYIGMPERTMQIAPYAVSVGYRAGDRYILCSDGLTEALTDEKIAWLCMQSGSAACCADRLVEQAVENGGNDNVTVIVCDVVE